MAIFLREPQLASCLLILLHCLFLNCASFWDRSNLSTSSLTQSYQVFFGRPLCLIPSIYHVIHHLSHPFNSHFPGEPGLSGFIEAKGDGSGGGNWSYKTCKAPDKSSPPTNQRPMFYRPDALPVTQPKVSKH